MRVIEAVNAHEALSLGMTLMASEGRERDSRNGKVLTVDGPVSTVYLRPTERVVFHQWRDANPFFHFYEALWMLAGRRDVAPLVRYVKKMASFSDDTKTFNAAYGHRWRGAEDQLRTIAMRLQKNPDDRRCVLQIWNKHLDMYAGDFALYEGRDAACNVAATFQVSSMGQLDMTLFCRSNDIVWGAYGANAVHMSMMQEYVALRARLPVGRFTQISVNWHAYREVFDPMYEHMTDLLTEPYGNGVMPHPLAQSDADMAKWDEDCHHFVRDDGRCPSGLLPGADPFWADVAWPVVRAHDVYKDGDGPERFRFALAELSKCQASDWRLACEQWIRRRYDSFLEGR